MTKELYPRPFTSFELPYSPGCSCVPIVTAQLQAHTVPEASKIYVSFCLHRMVHTLKDVENHPAEPKEKCNW